VKNKVWFILSLAIILGTFLLQAEYLFEELAPPLPQVYLEIISFARYLFYPMRYLVLTMLIWAEVKNLEKFHIEKFTLVSFAFFTLITFVKNRSENYLLLSYGLASILIIIALIINNPIIPQTNLQWSLAAVGIGSIFVIIITLIELLLRGDWQFSPLIRNSVVITAIAQIINELNIVPLEEMLYRGFLWGYLGKRGWNENKIFWVQIIIFWLSHISRLVTPFSFFISIPILALVSSKLTAKTKQVFPAIVSHVIINSVSAVLNLATF
jgi:membrane protease YdiL (CAAX protease family)